MPTRKPYIDAGNRGTPAWVALGLMLWLQVAVAGHQHDLDDDLRVHQCLTCMQLHGVGQALAYTAGWQAPDFSFGGPAAAATAACLGNRPLTRRSRSPPFSLL